MINVNKGFNDLRIKSQFINKPVDLNEIEKCIITMSILDDDIVDFEFKDSESMLMFLQEGLSKFNVSEDTKCVFVCFGDTNEWFDENPEYLITRDWSNAICYFETLAHGSSKFNLFTFENYEEASIYVKDLSETSSIGLN